MLKPNIKYKVTLTEEEREFLRQLVKKGNTSGHRIRHAQILPALDETPENEHWTDARIGAAYGCREQAVGKPRKRFVERGFDAALERKKRATPPWIKIDGEAEVWSWVAQRKRKPRCDGNSPRRTQGSDCGICIHGFSFRGALGKNR